MARKPALPGKVVICESTAAYCRQDNKKQQPYLAARDYYAVTVSVERPAALDFAGCSAKTRTKKQHNF